MSLLCGPVMIAEGYGSGGVYGDVLVYDLVSNGFLTTTGTLTAPRTIATATTLNDGRVIIGGGQTSAGMVTTAVDIFTE